METKQFIREFKDKDVVSSVFMVREKSTLVDKNGKPYISVEVGDVTGAVNGRIWEKVEAFDQLFREGDFVRIKGHVQVYQNRKQIIIHDLQKCSPQEVKLSDFLVAAKAEPEDMYREVLGFVSQIKNPHLKDLLQRTLIDPQVKDLLYSAPAAKTIHHAYMGGLLEHVLSICGIMKLLSSHYEFLDYDFLIFGAIFHDLGKIWELGFSQSIQYTQKGRLIGHMEIACELIDSKAKEISGFPDDLKDLCKHVVLSHHGKLEYGSPKRPKFLEALVVAMIDDLDSKLNTIYGFMKSELHGEESWTRYSQQFERYFYLDILRNIEGKNSAE